MKTIPLRAVPNQRFTFSNGQDRWVIEIKVAVTSMICNLWLNDEPVLLGSRIVAGVPIIWSPRLANDGNFGILTEGGEEPWWEKFGTSQTLVFWESDMAIASSRFVDFRSRNISPSLAELTALVNTAMKIEDIGYYPPTWQSLQEAISYAVSVVRSHAPEQGQILLATQNLTSAMGGLIEWLSINFAAGEWDEHLDFTRASTGTYWGPTRTLLEAAVDEARIQHDPATGEALGLLIEPQATNEILSSGDFGSSDWIRSAGSDLVTVQTGVGPEFFSGIGCDQLTIPAGSRIQQGFIGTDEATVYWILRHVSGDPEIEVFTRTISAIFDLVQGSVVSGSGEIRDLGGGFFLCSLTTTPQSDSNNSLRAPAGGEGGVYYAAHAQFERSSAPSSPIPTSGSPVTRAADNSVIDLSDVLNPREGTYVVRAVVKDDGEEEFYAGYYGIVENRVSFSRAVGGSFAIRAHHFNDSILPPEHLKAGDIVTLALAYNEGQITAAAFGEIITGSSLYSPETTISLVRGAGYSLPSNNRSLESSGIIAGFEYYPKALSEEELAGITAFNPEAQS